MNALQQLPTGEPLLNSRAVSAHLNISRVTLWKLLKKGDFPRPAVIGGCNRWTRSAIDKWVQEKIQEGQ